MSARLSKDGILRNAVGQKVAQFRQQRGWTQAELTAKLQLLGCDMTHQILAEIETGCRAVTDRQIILFSEVFCAPVLEV